MDRDTFIITVYCLVEDEFQKLRVISRVRHAGFTPELSDAEVITMAICGEYFKLQTDTDLFDYFAHHYRHFFPTLSERSLFVRQAANLWQFKAVLQRRLTCLSGQAHDPVQPIDTLPLPVCTYTRAPRDRCCAGQADSGDCDAKDLHYSGFKLGLRISRCGMITHFPLLAARPHDINHLEGLVEGFHGIVPADKGFIRVATPTATRTGARCQRGNAPQEDDEDVPVSGAIGQHLCPLAQVGGDGRRASDRTFRRQSDSGP